MHSILLLLAFIPLIINAQDDKLLTAQEKCDRECPSPDNYIPCDGVKNIYNCMNRQCLQEVNLLLKKNCKNDVCTCFDYVNGYRINKDKDFAIAKYYRDLKCENNECKEL
jgi:hypothetical protein